MEPATSAEQLIADTVDIRLRLKIKWGGVRGVHKLASIVQAIDRLGMRVRRENAGRVDVVPVI
jgi:hypothetical protein